MEKQITALNMKKGIFSKAIFTGLTIVMVLISGCGGSDKKSKDISLLPSSDSGTAVIQFNTMEHDFGAITAGEKVAYVFNFTNTGTASLVINSASTSCGCTVPQFSKKPLSPGQKGTLEVVFDSSGREGLQTKTITVQSNASVPVIILTIRADVKTETK